jgi:hypothetical protein
MKYHHIGDEGARALPRDRRIGGIIKPLPSFDKAVLRRAAASGWRRAPNWS